MDHVDRMHWERYWVDFHLKPRAEGYRTQPHSSHSSLVAPRAPGPGTGKQTIRGRVAGKEHTRPSTDEGILPTGGGATLQNSDADQEGGRTSGFREEEDANKAHQASGITEAKSGKKEDAQPCADRKEEKPGETSEVKETPEIWYEEE
ncbi:hypothetical protein NDU88_001966 [Pleurodeles waltl]|uniref:Uncharacterized protein n=1 Tax=Pleurodeles waltl TaxID=8319 RepID=A0AAV7RD41_PLEWA|nr:hypothetical protein NDU88_001966 [Pleurodeles waltl]